MSFYEMYLRSGKDNIKAENELWCRNSSVLDYLWRSCDYKL